MCLYIFDNGVVCNHPSGPNYPKRNKRHVVPNRSSGSFDYDMEDTDHSRTCRGTCIPTRDCGAMLIGITPVSDLSYHPVVITQGSFRSRPALLGRGPRVMSKIDSHLSFVYVDSPRPNLHQLQWDRARAYIS